MQSLHQNPNGSVGGEITKRLVALAEQQLGGHKK
ncbi:small, acid-soluble spore protein, alpha/beta type [Priestia megaterium]|nr:small, acid-soluble spore protein, alpha/beta type [Priestia megaterium]MDY0943515.1 small, acid-soluble spore protein, alpha/beta type [Priestia megaterium]